MRPPLPLAAAVTAAALLIASCSSSSSPAGPASTSPAITAAASTASSPSAPTSSASADATANLPSALRQQLSAILSRVNKAYLFPGALVGVWRPDGQWVGGVGNAGPGQGTRQVSPADATRIGEVTKTFTTTLLLQLAEQGRLSLDDPIEKYVPGMPNGDTATLRDLAGNASGIPDYTNVPSLAKAHLADPTRTWTPQQLVESVKGMPAEFPAGKAVHNSDTNAVLLGMVIEQVTGSSFAEALQAGIAGPLGLTSTSSPGASSALPTPHLSGVTLKGDPVGQAKDATAWTPTYYAAAGDVISTLGDLHAWTVALATGAGILSDASQQARLASLDTNRLGNGPDSTYGLGFGRTRGWIGHTGEVPGYSTVMEYDPATQTTVVILVNSDVNIQGINPAVALFLGMEPSLIAGR